MEPGGLEMSEKVVETGDRHTHTHQMMLSIRLLCGASVDSEEEGVDQQGLVPGGEAGGTG